MADGSVRFHPVVRLYRTIIEDVIENSIEFFLEEGVEKTVLRDLKKLWELKLLQSNAVGSFPVDSQLLLLKAHVHFLQIPCSTNIVAQNGRNFHQLHTTNSAESTVTWPCTTVRTAMSRPAPPNAEQMPGPNHNYKKVVVIQSDGRLAMYGRNQQVIQLGHLTISSAGSALGLPASTGGTALHAPAPRTSQAPDRAEDNSTEPPPLDREPGLRAAPHRAAPAAEDAAHLQQPVEKIQQRWHAEDRSAIDKRELASLQRSASQLAVLEELELAVTGCVSAHKEGRGALDVSAMSDPDYLDSLLEPQLLLELDGSAPPQEGAAAAAAAGGVGSEVAPRVQESEPSLEPWGEGEPFSNVTDGSAAAAALGDDRLYFLNSDAENLLEDLQFETSPQLIDPDSFTTHPGVGLESLVALSHHAQGDFQMDQMDFDFDGVLNVKEEPKVCGLKPCGDIRFGSEEARHDADELPILLQLDGAADSSEGHDLSSATTTSGEDDDSDGVDDMDAKFLEEELVVEEDPLNSGDDVSEQDMSEMFDVDNVVVCQYDKIHRSKNKWKFHFKDGIMNLDGLDYFFSKLAGDAEW
ncbi:TFIIA-alpha and beta-like factor [Lampetra fluviatilis]